MNMDNQPVFQLTTAMEAKVMMQTAKDPQTWLPKVLSQVNKTITEYARKGYGDVSLNIGYYFGMADCAFYQSNHDEKIKILVEAIQERGYQVKIDDDNGDLLTVKWEH